MADFLANDHGSIVLLTPVSDAAQSWADEHLPEDAQRWGPSYVIEARYAFDIVQGAQDDGLTTELSS